LGLGAITTAQWEKAEMRFEKVVALQPENWDACYYLGRVKKELGKQEEAKTLLQKVLKNTDDPSLKSEVNRLLNL
jgi:uncharacterized protein HemY